MNVKTLNSKEIFIVDCFWILLFLWLSLWGISTNNPTVLGISFFVIFFGVIWFGLVRRHPIYLEWDRFACINNPIYKMVMAIFWLPVIAVHYFFKKIRI